METTGCPGNMIIASKFLLVTMAMQCSQRALSLASLAFGLVATGGLALAIATDYWLLTSEPIKLPEYLTSYPVSDVAFNASVYYDDLQEIPELEEEDEESFLGFPELNTMTVNMHIGLWRGCISDHIPHYGTSWLPLSV